MKSLSKKYSYKSNKNEYFEENKEKSVEITMDMILLDAPNELIEKSKPKGNDPFEGGKRIRNTRKLTLSDDESTEMRIIFIYQRSEIKNRG